jgi:hypothetical protein
MDEGQRASPAAGLEFIIQNMCQCGFFLKISYIQLVAYIALHQVDARSCLFKRQEPND